MTTAQLPTITFPPDVFAALQPGPFLRAHLTSSSGAAPSRPNGRHSQDVRPLLINASSLTHAYGSAVIRLGNTAVVAGVRGEIVNADDLPVPYENSDEFLPRSQAEMRDEGQALGGEEGLGQDETIPMLGLLIPNIELSTGCAPGFLPGNPPSAMAQSLTARVLSLLLSSRMIDEKDLKIWYTPPSVQDESGGEKREQEPVIKAYWALYIDILVISMDGGAFDACWAATLAALRDTWLPRARWDDERECVICDDQVAKAIRPTLRGSPVPTSFAIFESTKGDHQDADEDEQSWILADPDGFEETYCPEQITVVLDRTSILRIEKHGGGIVGKDEMGQMVAIAQERWKQWQDALDQRDEKR